MDAISYNNFQLLDKSQESISDYDLSQLDIVQAKKIEPYYKILKLFSLRNDETITLCIAAFRTLARSTAGVFTREEVDQVLSYVSNSMRSKIFRTLLDYEWVISNGIRYEIPERVRNFHIFMSSALASEEEDYGKMIGVSSAMSDLDDAVGTDEETSLENFRISIGTLHKIREELKRVLDQKSSSAAREALYKSENVRNEMDKLERKLRKRNRKRYLFNLTTMVRAICADIINLHQDLMNFIHQDIQANARSFGQYLTPEQIAEFLHKCSLEQMTKLIKKNYSSSHQMLLVTKDELLQRGLSYLRREPEIQEPTPPPPEADIQRREIVIQQQEGATVSFYKELTDKLQIESEMPLHEVVVEDSFGNTLLRTGLLITVRHEIVYMPEKTQFDIVLEDEILSLIDGPIENITKGTVKKIPQYSNNE